MHVCILYELLGNFDELFLLWVIHSSIRFYVVVATTRLQSEYLVMLSRLEILFICVCVCILLIFVCVQVGNDFIFFSAEILFSLWLVFSM